ncbi:MAG: response regulator [Nevskiales bacterium]
MEDNHAYCKRMQKAIEAASGLHIQAIVHDCAEARQSLSQAVPDLALIDLVLPDGSGIDLIHEITAAHPRMRVMVVSMFGDEDHVIAAICAGASGYLLKDASDREIAEAIMQIMLGGSPISPGIAHHLLRHVRQKSGTIDVAALASKVSAPDALPVSTNLKLTSRELEVLQLVADGATYTEIGARLHVSINTVRSHIRHLYDKLAVTSRARLIPQAERRGLIQWKRDRN